MLLASVSSAEVQQPELELMPMPASVQLGTGQLRIDRSFAVTVTGFRDGRLDRAVKRFMVGMSRQTGMFLSDQTTATNNATLIIHTDHDSEKVQKVGEDESYELTISTTGATLNAPNTLGILRGLQTFLQLVSVMPTGFAVPVSTIKDKPRFPWRGLLIDVSRHFIPLNVLKRELDGMEAVKLNVLHWHLSDNEGFRVESKRFPKLQELASQGDYYTQAEIREFIAYGRDRGIRVVPEFDVPGHSRSWLVAYPDLASAPGPYNFDPTTAPDPAMDPTQDRTYKFLDKFFGEMAKLFPDAYLHIGGDEVNGEQWDHNPKIQEFMHAHGMKTDQQLQAYFNQRLQQIVAKHHKIMIGWDEVLNPDLPKSVLVQSWRGQQSLATAVREGHDGLLSFGYYLDLMWPAERHYEVDPMADGAADLTPEEKSRILGGEACMWAEWISPENIDSRLWPRLAAIAERLWSPQQVRDADSMYARLDDLSWRLEFLGLTQRSNEIHMLDRMAGSDDISALRVLADVVEPVKDYTRPDSMKTPWDQKAPLNRLVDAVPPESDEGRRFGDLVQRYIRSAYQDKVAESEIRSRLSLWQKNALKLNPLLVRSFLLNEVVPFSDDLSALASGGLAAMDLLAKEQPSTEAWRAQQLAIVQKAKAPQADLLLVVADPIEQLIDATARGTSPVPSAGPRTR